MVVHITPRHSKDRGFTLIETLVVVVIIGILAAVAIPQFLKYRESPWKSAVVQDVTNATRALEAYATEHDGIYPASIGANGSELEGYRASPDVTLAYTLTDGTDRLAYLLVGGHAKLPATEVYSFASETGEGTWNTDE
ncbi:type II secretion system protein [Populibacterium corticicola]|uniref:Type II secretion system protein n=1 Tax=Populibacterium corticicola TaxID=1812826 RepID=A0ABW5XEL2_9MICO